MFQARKRHKKGKEEKKESPKKRKSAARRRMEQAGVWKRPLSEVVSSEPSYQLSTLQQYPRHKLQSMLEEYEYINQPDQLQVQEQRCEADPLYCLMFNPYHQLELIDYDDPAEPIVGYVSMIDRLLGGMIEILERKYGEGLKKARIIQDACTYLKSGRANHQVKLFFILFVMKNEPEACEFIRALFIQDHPGNLWRDSIYDHFDRFMLFVDECVDKTVDFPASERNINAVVQNMILAAKQEYLLH